jgi:predicted metal-dependent peptidase
MGVLVQKGDFVLVDVDVTGEKSGQKPPQNKKDNSGTPSEKDRTPDSVEAPEFDPNAKTGPGYERTLKQDGPKSSGKTYSSSDALGKGGSKEKVKGMWERMTKAALSSSGGGLSDKARRMLIQLGETKPKVNWKRELKKFMDKALTQIDYVLPNRRALGTGDIRYGLKRKGEDTLKTLVLPVDTSGSISRDQIKVFLEEVLYLSTKMDIDKTIIIYCSDDIDAIDIVLKGKKPDLSKISSTGGNAKGFSPPFAWMEKNKINPSVVIYLTDTYAAFPSTSNYGINKFKDRIFWFICSKDYQEPPFGKKIHIPLDSKGNFT